MADKKISQLDNATTPLAGTETLPIVQSSTTKKVTVANLTAGRVVRASQLEADDSVNGRWTVQPSAAVNKLQSTTTGFGSWKSAHIQANPTDANMTWDTSGNTTVGVGNLIIGTSGKGIDFSANAHAAGMTSELLNDYEEGTWTPADASGAGLAVAVTANTTALYTKIGRLVVCSADITYPTTADASVARISMPIAATSTNPSGHGILGFKSDGVFQTSSVGSTGAVFLGPVNNFLTNANLSGVRFNMTWIYYV